MRLRREINYSFRAVPVSLMNEMPALREAMLSTQRDMWIRAIIEEFVTRNEANTYTVCDGPALG